MSGFQNEGVDLSEQFYTTNFQLGNQSLRGGAYGVRSAQAQFVPISQSGIRDIVVQGQGVAFGGKSFPNMAGTPDGIGTYSYILASANAYIDKTDPSATYIRDLDLILEEPDLTGNVGYSFDVVILYPTNSAVYSGFMAVEGANRGQATMCYLEDSSEANLYANTVPSVDQYGTSVPGTGSGNGFRYQQGDMIVYVGWEVGRPQSLSSNVVQWCPGNVDVNSSNNWPGQGTATKLAVEPRNSCGLGITLPICYDSQTWFTDYISGYCIDYGYFLDGNTGSFSNVVPPTSHDSFSMYYPIVPNTQTIVNIALNKNGIIGTPAVLRKSEYYVESGYGAIGHVVDTQHGFGGLTTGGSEYGNGYVRIDRAAIMRGTDGNPMNTSHPEFYNDYYNILEPDVNGYLRDYGCEYSITYTATGARPTMLGQLGIRDLVSYLRYETINRFVNDTNDFWGSYSGQTSNTMMWGYSQSGELVRGFLYNGFNADTQSRPVFDGCFVSHAGVNRRSCDQYRFSKPHEQTTQQVGPSTRPSCSFPYKYGQRPSEDPISGVEESILSKYDVGGVLQNCIPKLYHVMSSHDYFGLQGSLLFTDSLGLPSQQTGDIRYFYIQGAPHKMTFSYSNVDLASPITPLEGASQGESPVAQTFMFRSCYWNLREWIKEGSSSPINGSYLRAGDLNIENSVDGIPNTTRYTVINESLQSIKYNTTKLGWKDFTTFKIKNNTGTVVNENGLEWTGTQYVDGKNAALTNGINISLPIYGPPVDYEVLLPFEDSFGNDIADAGIPTPEIRAPLLTVRGYNTYIQGYNKNNMVYLSTSAIPLCANVSSQVGTNDPRTATIQSHWVTSTNWLNEWSYWKQNLVDNGWMLSQVVFPYDIDCYTNRGIYQASLLNTIHGLPIS